MTTTRFADKLRLALKRLSLSGAGLASELGADKSVVSRWLNGSVSPSAHNLSRLSALVATRVAGFTTLDWDRDLESLAQMFGADPTAIPALRGAPSAGGLPLANWDQLVTGAAQRGRAYEGFFRTTRPNPRVNRRFLHEYGMIRLDGTGLLRMAMGSAGAKVDGWIMPLNGQLYIIGVDLESGALLFGIFHGLVGATRVDVFDGLILTPGFDMGRSPTATGMLCERIGELTGDRAADDARYAELASQSPMAPEGSVPDHIQAHLARDCGPIQLDVGGEWLLNMALSRSMARGPDYDAYA